MLQPLTNFRLLPILGIVALAASAFAGQDKPGRGNDAKPPPESDTSKLPQPSAADDVADVPSKDILIGGDEKKRYFLIGHAPDKAAPKAGYRLLLVLPGGDGGVDFNGFIRRVYKKALPEGYVVAQLVAPKWRDDEERIVWPTQGLPDSQMKFSTEDFIDAVVKDVKSRCKIDEKSIFALAWSSSGPAIYSAAVREKTPLTGAFIAMSVFKPDQMPKLDHVKGRGFYLLHSPQDFIKMRFPEEARDKLSAAGAKVELQTYEGGHGWRGDVFGNIRKGVEWLEKSR